jgi:hypothetical protein
MTLSKVLKITVLSAAVLGAAVTLPWAFCDSAVETYAIFHCSDRSYFAPVPAPFTPQEVTGVFWQLGFGSRGDAIRDTGAGTDGTGVQSKAQFNGNDNGLFILDVRDAAQAFPTFPFPPGSVCLGSNNWANFGVDGCSDNTRPAAPFTYDNQYDSYGPYQYANNDNILNPYFGTQFQATGFYGYYSLASIMDYPTAVLLKTPGDSFFALAAVTNMDRGNTHDAAFGPCHSSGGTNPAACDIRQGFYGFQDVKNGSTNVMTGLNDVVEWQPAPRPRISCVADCAGVTPRQLSIQVGPVKWYHDMRSTPSNNPTLATRNLSLPRDATRAAGVGVVDLLRKWGGLLRYSLEAAPVVTDPGGNVDYAALVFTAVAGQGNLTPPLNANGEATGPVSINLTSNPDTCYRVALSIGKLPEVSGTLTTAIECRKGRCGDVGYSIRSGAPGAITCVGGALISENIADSAIAHARGVYTLTWSTTSELSVQGFDIFAVSRRGEQKVADVACSECTTSLPGSYTVEISKGDLRGGAVEAFKVKMRGGSGDEVTLDASEKGTRGAGGR